MPVRSVALPVRRGANVFVIDFADSQLVRGLVSNYARSHGGVWIGGNATLTLGSLEFRANAANRLFHGGRGDLSLDLRLIQDIAVQRALVSDVIAVRTSNAVVQLRCFRADEFAADLWATATTARLRADDPSPLPAVRELSESRFAGELLEIFRSLQF